MAVIAVYNRGKSYSQIFKLLKPLKISRMFIYRAIKPYEELWGVEDRAQSGRLKSSRAEDDIKTVRQRIRQNPLWKQNIMSRELNISTQSMSRLIRDDQHVRAHRHSKGHILTPPLKTIRRAKQSLSSIGTPRTDMKTFSSRTRKSSPSRSSTTSRTTKFMIKRFVR